MNEITEKKTTDTYVKHSSDVKINKYLLPILR